MTPSHRPSSGGERTVRIRILYDTDTPGLLAMVEAWLQKWRPATTVVSAEHGCGCHHDRLELEVPESAVAELPAEVLEATQ